MKHIKQIIFDADDTLWESNIFYLKAAYDFFDLLENEGIKRSYAEDAFNKLENQVVEDLGYGSINFIFILKELYRKFQITGKHNKGKLNRIIEEFNSHKLGKPNLFENVPEITEKLSHEYRLYILTKGNYQEQESKILKSDLLKFLQNYFILDEKNDPAYANLLKVNNWNAEETCMVGNSPKSDINPALRNNMYAVHIPYRNTWKVDIEPIIKTNGKYKKINSFIELTDLFLSK